MQSLQLLQEVRPDQTSTSFPADYQLTIISPQVFANHQKNRCIQWCRRPKVRHACSSAGWEVQTQRMSLVIGCPIFAESKSVGSVWCTWWTIIGGGTGQDRGR